jgi:hypothetical protein
MSHAVFATPAPATLDATQLAAIDRLLLAALKDGPHAIRRAIKLIVKKFSQLRRGDCWRRLRQLRRSPELASPAAAGDAGSAATPPKRPPVRRGPCRPWTAEDDERLLNWAGYEPVKKIAQRLARSETAVRFRMGALGLSARVKDGYSLRSLRELLRVSPKRIRCLIGSGLLRVRDPRITAAAFAAYFERQQPLLDKAAGERFAAAQEKNEEGYSWERAASILGVDMERIHELLGAGTLKVLDPFVTERQFEEFCTKHGSEINLSLLDPETAQWLREGYGIKKPVNTARKLSRAQKHAVQVHLCRCGREIAGNAYFRHVKTCPEAGGAISRRSSPGTSSAGLWTASSD